jgi:DnaK suppressor protein
MSIDLHEIELALHKKRNEVAGRMRSLGDITVERLPDPIDELEMLTEREAAITQMELDSRLLREIDAALRRIEDGEFGRCTLCGEEIGPRRLNAVPRATYCVACQDEVDRSRTHEDSPLFSANEGF